MKFAGFGNIFSMFARRNGLTDQQRATNERLQRYARQMRAYQGYSVRGILNTNIVRDWRRLKFNFNRPVVNLGAAWFAAKPLEFEVSDDARATAAASAIWARSGAEATLLENAIAAGIYGEIVGIATQDDSGLPLIEFVDPSICMPQFLGSDYCRLASLEIAYEELDASGEIVSRREMWGLQGMECYAGDQLTDRRSYAMLPAVWIRNSAIKGLPYGISDIDPILELVEEYDHLASKQTRIVDYYASPNVVFEGLQKPTVQAEKGIGTVFYLPAGGKGYFLEWNGNTPDVQSQLTTIRNGISEISQVPAIAFGVQDAGRSNLSGIAMQILYGPLISKTAQKHAQWGPALEYLMWLCLQASGYSVAREDVRVHFPSATPVDGQSASAIASQKIAAKTASRRTIMSDQGIPNPDSELKRILLEEKLLQLVENPGLSDQNANTAARSGGRGIFAQEVVAGTGLNKPDPNASPLAVQTGTTDQQITDLFERFDALVAAETQNIRAAEDPLQGDEANV